MRLEMHVTRQVGGFRHSVRRQNTYRANSLVERRNSVPGSPTNPAILVMPPASDFDVALQQTLTESEKEYIENEFTGKGHLSV